MKEKASLKNEKGVIAESYADLQSISALEKAQESFPTKKASQISSFKAILQSIEIGILNISDLLQRITTDVENNEIGKTVVKTGWYKDFNFLLNQLTNCLSLISVLSLTKNQSIDLSQISSIRKFAKILKSFDKKFLNYVKTQNIDLKEVIGNHSLNNNLTQLIHYSRISNLEIAIWEKSLSKTFSPIDIIDYETFTGAKFLHKAVNGVKLEGDTFFTQFRGLHQIPELLTSEINNNIEATIKSLRNKKLEN